MQTQEVVVGVIEWLIAAVVGIVLGVVFAVKTRYTDTVLKPLWNALLAAAVNASSPREFLKIGWQNGHDLAIAMYKNQKAAGGVVGMVLTVIVAAIAILIGIIVYANVSSSMPTTGLDNETQQMIANLNTNVNSSFTLLAVGIIVLAASFILTVLFVSLGRQ